jgi:hypothetical protein
MPARDSSEANGLEIFFMVLTNFQDSVELTLSANPHKVDLPPDITLSAVPF